MVRETSINNEKRRRLLFLGPFQPELEEALLDSLKNKKESDPLAPVVVLVGSNLLGLYLRRLLVQRGFSHMNLRFLTFIDLAKALAEESLSKDKRSPLPRFGDLVGILSLGPKIGKDSYFNPIAERRGFQRALAATFQDLWDGGLEEIPMPQGKKLIELGKLYRAYRSMIRKEFYNHSELFFRGAAEVQNFLQVFGGQDLILYGFYDFTEAQKQLMKACIDRLDVVAFMPWRPSPGFVYASATLHLYEELGFAVRNLEKPHGRGKTSAEILQRDLFQEKSRRSKAPDDSMVLIISAANEVQEIREVAREILRLAREEDIYFHEMAILLRNMESYGALILETFQNLKIPVCLQAGIPLARTQAGKSALLLLDLVGSNLRRPAVMEFLTFAPIAWSRFFPEEPSPSRWDFISRQAGIVEGKGQWEEKLASWMAREKGQETEEDQEEGHYLKKITECFWSFLKGFFSALERFPLKGSWKEMCAAAIRLMGVYFEQGESQEAIFQILQELESLDALNREINLYQFREIFSEALHEKALPQGAFQKSGVLVSDLMPARGLSFRAVFIPGLVERSFPAPVRQDPLLLDPEREAVNEALGGRGRIPLKRYRFQEEQLLFSLALGSAREKLVLSYPRLDSSSGRERIPSFFLLRVGEALQGQSVDYSQLETLPVFHRIPLSRLAPEDSAQAIDEEEFDLGQVGRAIRNHDRGEIAYLMDLFPILERAERLARRRWGLRIFTEYDGCLQAEPAKYFLRKHFALSGQALSPTRLEMYASCPFKYFLAEVLRLKVLPSPEEIWRLQPSDRGKLVHDILYQFHLRVAKKLGGPLRAEKMGDYLKIILEISRVVFDEAERQGLTGFPLLWEIDREALLEDLKAFLQMEDSEEQEMIPTGFEIRFGYPAACSS